MDQHRVAKDMNLIYNYHHIMHQVPTCVEDLASEYKTTIINTLSKCVEDWASSSTF